YWTQYSIYQQYCKSLQTGADVGAGERLLTCCFSRPVRSVGINFVPTVGHVATRGQFPKRFVVVEVEMAVHFHRIYHAGAIKVIGIRAAAAQVEISLRRIDSPGK